MYTNVSFIFLLETSYPHILNEKKVIQINTYSWNKST